MIQLPPYKEIADHQHNGKAGYKNIPVNVVGKPVDDTNQQSESKSIQQGTPYVETLPVGLHRIARKKFRTQTESDQSDRNIDRKQPRPVRNRKDTRGNRRAGRRRNSNNQGIEPHSPA